MSSEASAAAVDLGDFVPFNSTAQIIDFMQVMRRLAPTPAKKKPSTPLDEVWAKDGYELSDGDCAEWIRKADYGIFYHGDRLGFFAKRGDDIVRIVRHAKNPAAPTFARKYTLKNSDHDTLRPLRKFMTAGQNTQRKIAKTHSDKIAEKLNLSEEDRLKLDEVLREELVNFSLDTNDYEATVRHLYGRPKPSSQVLPQSLFERSDDQDASEESVAEGEIEKFRIWASSPHKDIENIPFDPVQVSNSWAKLFEIKMNNGAKIEELEEFFLNYSAAHDYLVVALNRTNPDNRTRVDYILPRDWMMGQMIRLYHENRLAPKLRRDAFKIFKVERPTAPTYIDGEDASEDTNEPRKLGGKFNVAADEQSVGEMYAEAREALGLTKVAAAELAGMPESSVRKLEKGSQTPTLKTLRNYAESLGYEARIELVPIDKG